MRVIHIISGISKSSGGPSRSVQGLVAALNGVGVDTWLISCQVGDKPWIDGINNFLAPTGDERKNLSRFIEDSIKRINPDIIHLHGIWQMQIHLAARIARKLNIPYIETPRGMLEPWSLEQKKWKKRLAMWLYQRTDLKKAIALHATADSEAAQFKKLGFDNPIIMSPNGVNLPKQLPGKTRDDARHRVLFVSRMHQKKGVLELVEAWAKVRPQGWCCELVYTLNGETERAYEAQVKDAVNALGLRDSFIFTGALSDDAKWEAYCRADVFVLPTYSENFGIVIAEALFANLPVITTKGTPWAELEEHNCGKWIDIGVEPLVVALREMTALTDDERSVMGENGRKLVEDRYSWPQLAKKMKEAYEQL